jgi:hypothetical protein
MRRSQIKKLFAELNKGNYEPILGTCATTFEHWFVGKSHALAGHRTSMAVMRSWYARLFKIFPNIQFELHQVLVTGWPWNTVVAVEWSDYYTLLNGEKRQSAPWTPAVAGRRRNRIGACGRANGNADLRRRRSATIALPQRCGAFVGQMWLHRLECQCTLFWR